MKKVVFSNAQLLGTILQEGHLAEERERKGAQENLAIINNRKNPKKQPEPKPVIISPENLHDDEVHFT